MERPAHKCVILLTACVDPQGMANTLIQDVGEREAQYCQAIDFYLRATDVPIVVCENTGYDFSVRFAKPVAQGRLECLCFDGNSYDKSKGKGYGEAAIIIHAVGHSRLLRRAKYMVKITGRLIVRNIGHIVGSPLLRFDNLCRCSLMRPDYFSTVVFVGAPRPVSEYLQSKLPIIDDSSAVPCHLEHVLASYAMDTDCRCVPFAHSPVVVGLKGISGVPYSSKPDRDNLLDNLFFLSVAYKNRGCAIKAASCMMISKTAALIYKMLDILHTLSL